MFVLKLYLFIYLIFLVGETKEIYVETPERAEYFFLGNKSFSQIKNIMTVP